MNKNCSLSKTRIGASPMRKTLSRQGSLLCLVGNLIALVALFLPYYSPPPESLWYVFILLAFQQPNKLYDWFPWIVGVLLLLVLTNGFLTVLALFPGSRQRKIRTISLNLTIVVLLYYLGAALFTLLFFWVGEEIANTSPKGVTIIDTLSFANIGAWLIPGGLFLALVGCILLQRSEYKSTG